MSSGPQLLVYWPFGPPLALRASFGPFGPPFGPSGLLLLLNVVVLIDVVVLLLLLPVIVVLLVVVKFKTFEIDKCAI